MMLLYKTKQEEFMSPVSSFFPLKSYIKKKDTVQVTEEKEVVTLQLHKQRHKPKQIQLQKREKYPNITSVL